MTRMIRSAGLAIALLAGAGVAFAAPAAGQDKPASKSTKASSHSITGKLDSASSDSITVATSTGKETMTVSSTTQIHSGSKKLAAADLSSETGHTVKVRYKEANGQKTAESVQIQAPAHTAKTDKKS